MHPDYYSHEYASNSDLKRWLHLNNPEAREEPENLEEIFDLGTLIHAILLEPHKADVNHKDYKLAVQMAETFMKDPLCRQFMMISDFKREWEFYSENTYGIKGRCKMDGKSAMLKTILEYKGLGVTSQQQFMDAIYRFDYDQGAAWYLDVSKYERCLIVAVSKKNPRQIFKLLVDRNHPVYTSGQRKVQMAVELWKELIE